MRLYARVNRHVEAFELKNLATIWFECCKVNMQTILLSQFENATVPDAVLDHDFDARRHQNIGCQWKDNDNTLDVCICGVCVCVLVH